ncbi:hypothetical protein EDC01DRAFT_618882 [Geopyxis carbonaria]|nr:hypothetical protein EDC01DRAFT_618882 [Geopyxis carbonaria]
MRPTTTSSPASTGNGTSNGKLHIDLGASNSALPAERPGTGVDELPPLSALFLIYFDIKAGYTIKWKRTAEGVDLDGVEFKSLPSGLHNLKEDLVYFVHEKHAGVSAFINVPAEESQRGALMLSVGILVPLSYGRLGRSWRHAEGLKTLARQFSSDTTTLAPFEEYYERFRVQDGELVGSPISRRSTINSLGKKDRRHFRTNSVSDTALILPGQTLSQHHPALSLSEFMDTFGPLIFPIYRAALARKRILIITHAPVEKACNFVYDISILSNIPLSVSDILPCEPSRLKPLFAVGVHDIPMLEREAKIRDELLAKNVMEGEKGAFVACTTDEVLAMKTNLYDVLIRLPPDYSKDAKEKVWPTVECPAGIPFRATQRDLRRYRALKQSLYRRYHRNKRLFLDDEESNGTTPHTLAPSSPIEDESDVDEPNNIEEVCEKLTWREIAYSSFMWWASAGERRHDEESEDGQDSGATEDDAAPHWQSITTPATVASASTSATTATATPQTSRSRNRRRTRSIRRRSTNLMQAGVGGAEMDLIAYFHRCTQRVISVLAESEEHGEDGDDEDEELTHAEGYISLDEVRQMGLDQYSDVDAEMLEEIARRWFGRSVAVEKWKISCCGIECG